MKSYFAGFSKFSLSTSSQLLGGVQKVWEAAGSERTGPMAVIPIVVP